MGILKKSVRQANFVTNSVVDVDAFSRILDTLESNTIRHHGVVSLKDSFLQAAQNPVDKIMGVFKAYKANSENNLYEKIKNEKAAKEGHENNMTKLETHIDDLETDIQDLEQRLASVEEDLKEARSAMQRMVTLLEETDSLLQENEEGCRQNTFTFNKQT